MSFGGKSMYIYIHVNVYMIYLYIYLYIYIFAVYMPKGWVQVVCFRNSGNFCTTLSVYFRSG